MNFKELLKEKFISGEFEYKGAKRIFELLGVKANFEKDIVRKELDILENEGFIVYESGKYVLLEHSKLIKGTLKGNERGFAFLIPENKELNDFFVPSKSLNGAIHGDIVLIKHVKSEKGRSSEGEVVRVLEHKIKTLVGTFEGENGFGFVIPDDKSFFVDIYIPIKLNNGAKTGDKVLVQIVSYPEKRKNPEGKVLEVLGKKYDLKAEELSIIKNASLEIDFGQKVLNEVKKIPSEVLDKDLESRQDFTNDFIVTIDGEDSRDFDDAISINKDKNGIFTLGVHIADVSNYVKMGAEIDKEALRRSTSVYFPERVIPMLPFELSNGICSLNEGVKRLTLSCIMKINQNGEILDKQIVNSVIINKRRLTYTTVQKIIDGEEIQESSEVVNLVGLSYELMKILQKKREERGNIDLTVKESHIFVKNKNVVVEPRQSVLAYKVIEEFMIVANETVAEFVYYMKYPFVYRIHEKPSQEKIATFKAFLNALGLSVKWSYDNCYSKDFADLLKGIEDKPYVSVVNKVMLRSMQKARYSPENLGHFGLSSKCYCHFTSPIRRYPDLMVHRVLKNILDGRLDFIAMFENKVVEVSTISSENERKADEVERTMDDYYKCLFMKKRIGETYNGIISGVTNFGIFVELENTVEGIVKLETLPKGSYQLDENTFTLKSQSNSYTLGDSVEIKVVGVNMGARKVEFTLI